MDISFEQYQQIQQYLDNTMPADEVPAFELLLATDKVLEEHFLFEKQLREGLEYLHEAKEMENYQYTPQGKGNSPLDDPAHMRRLIENAGKEYENRQDTNTAKVIDLTVAKPANNEKTDATAKVVPMGAMIRWAVAACTLLAVSAMWFNMNSKSATGDIANNNNIDDTSGVKKEQLAHSPGTDTINKIKDPDKGSNLASLFKQFFKKDEVPSDRPGLLANLLDNYSDNNYKMLQRLNTDNLPESRDPSSSENENRRVIELAHYFKGLANLMDGGNSSTAVNNLKWAADSTTDTGLKIKAHWYLALALVKNNEKGKAVIELKKLSASDEAGIYKSSSLLLLKELK